MIERYTRKVMGDNWSLENRFQCMLEVEVAVAQAQAEYGIIPKKAALDIRKKSKFSVRRIATIEKKTKHDVIAFVSNMAENVGENGRYIHFGMTSSDVLDTALSVQLKMAWDLIEQEIGSLKKTLLTLSQRHRETLCSGRTHGMHAEPTTFGLKLMGHLHEIQRGEKRLKQAMENSMVVKLSGAVGTYSAQDRRVEAKVGQILGLQPEVVATQVIPRDRHADVLNAIALLGCGVERLSVELRHLQRTEVGEVCEGFAPGQKGSSAMPHKKNPISAENLTGVARLLRSYSGCGLENVALWHERDISHSSVERVVFPDAFILLDYMLDRMNRLIAGLYVDETRMLENMKASGGQLFSSHVLLELVRCGLTREEAYRMVQKVSHGLSEGEHLHQALLNDPETSKYLKSAALNAIFSGRTHKKSIVKVFDAAVKKVKL